MSQVFAARRPRAAVRPALAREEIDEVEAAFARRDPASSWVGYAALGHGRLALFFRDGGDPVLTLGRDAAGAVTLTDRRGTVVASAHGLGVLLRWLAKPGPDRSGAAADAG